MLRKFLLVLGLGISGSVASMLFGHSQALACTNSVCGYFANGNDSAWCNVLPDPSIKSIYGTGNCWLNSSGGNGHSMLYGDNTTASFIADMSSYLNQTSGNGGYNLNSQTGAAFLIDYMLGIDFHTVSPATGIADAKARFAQWSAIVQSLGVNTCSLAGQTTCPGKSFGINFSYQPPYFCSSPVTTSGYDPWLHDTPFYRTTSTTCDHDWRASVPEIVIYWNNGANSFHIGSQCGNAQTRGDKLPALNSIPTGTISVSCNVATGQQTATVTLSDADGATDGYITTGSWTSGTVGSPGPASIPIPLPPTTDPYVAQGVSLHAKDVGATGTGTYAGVASDNTQVPCSSFSCGNLSATPSQVDPYMQFQLDVSVTNGVGSPPPGATISITVTPPAGASYSYSGSKAASGSGSVSSATFSGLGPTNNSGVFGVKWILTGSGVNVTCNDTFQVVYMPYLNVYGGDVMTGSSPAYSAGASTCATNAAGGIHSWNNVGASFSGAGTQYAVQALGQIGNFASALSSSSTAPTGLSFANTGLGATKLNSAQGLFGGYFGAASGNCDFTSDLKTSPVNADVTIAGHAVAAGTQEIHYITGHDVYISGNVTYGGGGGWANASQVPYFKVVVAGGDIYINNNISQLDGIFVAESTGGASGGRIFTCATGLRSAVNPTSATFYSTCNHKLTVNGVFVGKQVLFLRTTGSIGQAKNTDTLITNHDAEVFNYTPEVWLPRGSGSPSGGYTAITGLPPVL